MADTKRNMKTTGGWTLVKIEVRGDKARLYVNGAPQPVLVVALPNGR
jgi:hypothetical protein